MISSPGSLQTRGRNLQVASPWLEFQNFIIENALGYGSFANQTKNPPYYYAFGQEHEWWLYRWGMYGNSAFAVYTGLHDGEGLFKRSRNWDIFDAAPTWEYGYIERGDIIGTWVQGELQRAFSALMQPSDGWYYYFAEYTEEGTVWSFNLDAPSLNPYPFNDQKYSGKLYLLTGSTENDAYSVESVLGETTDPHVEFLLGMDGRPYYTRYILQGDFTNSDTIG